MDSSAKLRESILSLLNDRSPGATICPSEVARAAAEPDDWRPAMPGVHAAVDELMACGRVKLSWKGVALATRAGPYRISRT